ncbi:MAG: TonB-dependent receptor [Acinetobacter sp.]|uniref:TonB-dependent receptor plug domain-containing protein n=1 Tax=Acinetobacter sp. TaxID=472 RepID=UPI0026DD1E11|nr:TonB-dependent receptor [Acinetobacter sp.]MDO4579568.1 TonB-dependent receptor [Acinetobacter sp.]
MSIQFQPTALVGAIALAMGFSTSVFATESQEQPAVNAALDTLVVTATRSEEKIGNVPARISIIEPHILEQSPIAELPHLLMSDASINMVQSGGFGQVSSIFTRGTNSNHTLVLRDGIRLNTASSGMASLSFLDTTDIQQIEVLKGPASVLYGTDAIGGVIQMVSKTPEKNQALLTTEVGENSTYKTVIGADLAEQGFYAQIRGQRLETDGTKIKETSHETAAFDQKGYSAKLGVDQQNYAVSLDYQQNEGNIKYDNFGALNNQDFETEIINLKGNVKLKPQLELNARLSQFQDDLYQNDPNFMGQFDFASSQTREAELYAKLQLNSAQQILIGTQHQNIQGNVLSYGQKYETDLDSLGYYFQHQYQTNTLNTQVGIRVEDHEKYGTHTIGQAAARYQLLPQTSLYTNVGTAFRSPNLNELYSSSGNPNLKPEESLSFEIGLDQQLNHGLTTGITLYRNQVDHLIDATEATGYSFRNLDRAIFEGSELYLNWQAPHAFIKTGYHYVRAKDDTTGEDLSRRPRQKATLTLGWAEEQFGLSTTLTANSSSDNSAYDDVRIPGHFNVDMSGYYQLHPAIKLFTNIQNVSDSKYRTAYGSGSYYINGGRLASVGVTVKY